MTTTDDRVTALREAIEPVLERSHITGELTQFECDALLNTGLTLRGLAEEIVGRPPIFTRFDWTKAPTEMRKLNDDIQQAMVAGGLVSREEREKWEAESAGKAAGAEEEPA